MGLCTRGMSCEAALPLFIPNVPFLWPETKDFLFIFRPICCTQAQEDVFGGIKALIFPLLLENKMCTHHRHFLKE